MEELETGSEVIDSGADTGASSDASASETAGAVQTAPEQKTDTTPFHEHPRFKELVEQKNSYQGKFQDMESRYKAMEQQFNSFKESQPKAPSETDDLLKDLDKVDPRLANVIRTTLKAAEIAEANKAQFEQYQAQSQEQKLAQTRVSALDKVNSLHEANKVTPALRDFITNKLHVESLNGRLDISDHKAIEAAFNEQFKAIKAYEDSLKRDVTKSYVQDKKTDAAVPASVPKGAQAKPKAPAIPSFKSKDDLRSAVVKSYMKEVAAAKDATNT